jgi:hypothetical protein
MCLSKRWKFELVTSRFCILTTASFEYLVAQKPGQALVYPVCPESVQH